MTENFIANNTLVEGAVGKDGNSPLSSRSGLLSRIHLTLGLKYALALGALVLAATTAVTIIALTSIGKLGTVLKSVHDDAFLPFKHAESINEAIDEMQVAVLSGMEATGDRQATEWRTVAQCEEQFTASLAKYEREFTVSRQPRMRELLKEYGALQDQIAREQNSLELVRSEYGNLLALVDKIIDLAKGGQHTAALALYEQVEPLFDQLDTATTVFKTLRLEEAGFASRKGHDVFQTTRWNLCLSALVILAVVGGTSVWLTRAIVGPIRQLCLAAKAVAQGDLSHAIAVKSGDEVGELATSFNAMIGDLKRSQDDVLASRDAARTASRSKSEFLANMSHEIRTPMNGIIGMTELVLDTELTREQREYLGMVKTSGHALLGLINDILDFSKIEAGKLELEAISFSLRDCIGGNFEASWNEGGEKGLELTADIPCGVPDHVVGDPMRLRQILINLTDNAIKFTERGDIMVRVANETAVNGEVDLHFYVADTGIGIPPEKQAKIFEAFVQADGSTTRTYGGSGLGLAIATELVQKMRGQIWVESKVGEGTTFHFTARLPVRHTPVPCVKSLDPRTLEGLRTLIVDDNEVNRRILHEMLTHWRMRPAVVESGAEAFEEMLRAARAASPYPLVLLDAVMPGMDGFALAEKIQRQPELSGATVMMLSSAMPVGAVARCGELGVASFLTKPVTQSDLLDAILIAVNGEDVSELTLPAAPSDANGSGLRILLAEDNVINRALATGILEKRGHALTHAANGRDAVEAARAKAFDVILMDVQMPGMDGFEATRQIRELEKATHHHTPIVAMTAHAMAGDRERCLAAGMDHYISKPLAKEELVALLATFQPARVVNGPSQAVIGPSVTTLFSREKLLDQLDRDEDLMQRMIALFEENTPRLLAAIRDAITRRSGGDLARSAHALLSSLGAFGAVDAHRLALRLEELAQREDYEHTNATFAALERETADIYRALAIFGRSHA